MGRKETVLGEHLLLEGGVQLSFSVFRDQSSAEVGESRAARPGPPRGDQGAAAESPRRPRVQPEVTRPEKTHTVLLLRPARLQAGHRSPGHRSPGHRSPGHRSPGLRSPGRTAAAPEDDQEENASKC